MNDLRKAAEELIKEWDWECGEHQNKALTELIETLRQALAQPEQEPVAWGMQRKDGVIIDVICPQEHAREPGDYTIPLYTAQPKREWVGLTDEEVKAFKQSCHLDGIGYDTFIKWFAIGIEAELKEKNT